MNSLIFDPKKAGGKTADLEDRVTTMSYSKHKCSCGAERLIRSARRVYCYHCKVWWWISR